MVVVVVVADTAAGKVEDEDVDRTDDLRVEGRVYSDFAFAARQTCPESTLPLPFCAVLIGMNMIDS